MKCYYMLQNVRVTAFTLSELLKENQQEGKITQPAAPPGLGLKCLLLTSIVLGATTWTPITSYNA